MSKHDLTRWAPNRRQFLGGLAAAGAGLLASRCGGSSPATAGAQSAQTPVPVKPRLFDMHHHFGSPTWIKTVKADGALNTGWDGYTPAKMIEEMDKAGIDMAFASQSTPGVWLVDGYGNNIQAATNDQSTVKPARHTLAEARMLTREMNDFGAKMVSDYPKRFAVLAALAMPDVDGSLKEIEYIFDKLKLQGIGILTSYGTRYLGDPLFTPIFEELNRRKAVVYTHPTAAPCCRGMLPGVGETTIEFSVDTNRTIVNWITSGAAKKFPDIQWIHSHGGGTLVASRFLGDGENLRADPKPDSHLYYMRKYYYDTMASNEATLFALKRTMGASQIVFGHFDIPRPREVPAGEAVKRFQRIAATDVFTPAELDGIANKNVLRLFPQYA